MKQTKLKLAMLGMAVGMIAMFGLNHVMADSTPATVPTDTASVLDEAIQSALSAGAPTFGIGLLLSGIRFMGKKINDANAATPQMTPFQFHMFLFTGAIGFVAGVILNAVHASVDVQSGIAVVLTYFITQLAPAFKNLTWTGSKTKTAG